MGFFDLFRQPDINQGVEEYRAVPQAILLDVRTPEEYGGGHVPGSRNLPLQQIEKITAIAEKKETPLFVYCQSGARSRQAVSLLQRMGYENVNNIGGMAAYHNFSESQ
nr:rhodanese-like domain-containing protein [uncultured Acetatifactor sp.]